MARQKKFTTEELYVQTKHLLLEHGYDGFSFSQLAEKLNVARSTIYKYFENKEELATAYMLYEMNKFLKDLETIHDYSTFNDQLDYLLDLMFDQPEIQQLILIGQSIPIEESSRARKNHEQLEKLHLDMYEQLDGFVKLGKENGHIRPQIPNSLVLGYIFQSIAIPNHEDIPYREWAESIKDVIRHGLFK
ncbi:TetR/AcrR family transcriptional regulator [Aquisalibacillus elongatus]|uniref:TetR family transcriptional regulator n=1 Tax=Aquisalibacillus elongatus TaxID=485577 RepID=A0A3N5C345_9BACI|nr:TetR/AcrR family transcriptional regulator [Aquisalibacillus elongatus]RPF50641.1 TetR family transcriptional regulator [Aquisalibacillus elongatus]